MTAELRMRIYKTILDFKYPVKYIGAYYLRDGIMHCLENPQVIDYMNRIYCVIAKKHGTGTKNVERNIRTVINKWWDYDKCGGLFDKKPTASELVHTLVARITIELKIY